MAQKDSVIPCCVHATVVEERRHSSDSQNKIKYIICPLKVNKEDPWG